MRTIQQREALAKLRDIQGVPLSVLVAMFILAKPVSKKDLARALRRSEPTVSEAVDFLEFEGHIVRENYRSWSLAAGQMFLPGLDLLPSEETRNQKNFGFETQKSLVSGTCTCTTTTTTHLDDKDVVSNDPETQNSLVSEELAKTLAAIRISGAAVSKRAWPALAALEWVTTEYLESMAEWVNGHDDPNKRTVGFFVHCVKSGDIVPETIESETVTLPCGIIRPMNYTPCDGREWAMCENCEFLEEV